MKGAIDMLNILKQDLIRKEQAVSCSELMLESVANDDIRDAFLDDTEALLLGSENDPLIAEQIEDIPESNDYDLTDEEMDELESLEESIQCIPETE